MANGPAMLSNKHHSIKFGKKKGAAIQRILRIGMINVLLLDCDFIFFVLDEVVIH